jgi:polar amino acid transport system substrate-binding protein
MEVDDRVPILAVDDRAENLLALEAILTDPLLRLVNARSGQEALKHLLHEEFAVILMDASMPVMDGFETARTIRSRAKTRSTPIIFVTATHKDSLSASKGYDIGAVDYIFKPVVPEVLRAKVFVFAELFRKTKEIRRQAEELSTYKVELEQRLDQLASLNEELQRLSRTAEEARDQAQAASQFQSLVVESVPNGIIMVDQAGKIVLVNAQTEKMFQYTREELLGRQIEMLVPSRFREKHPEHLENFNANPSVRMMGTGRDLYAVRKDGSELPIEIGLTPIKTETGQHVLASVIDITERKKAEEGLRIARDQAQAASQFKSEFVANVSHEIRTPMNAIIGMCNLLMKTSLNDTQRDYGLSIKEASNALLNIINDILDLSKIEAGKLELEIKDFDPVQLVESICDLLVGQSRAKEISLVSFIEPTMPARLRGDPDRLRQVLLNLLNNAIKFSEKDEVVVRATIEAEEGNTVQVLFSVDDSGIGLSEADCQRLFQPFMQADASISRKYGGTGLGLSICKSLVALMGGTIGVKSEKGKGSTFWCKVPLEKRSAAPVMTIKEGLKNMRVLIVDEQQHAREMLHDYVVSWSMRSGVASSSREALKMMRQAHLEGNPFTLAIIDLVMPDMNGAELAKEIQLDPAISTTKMMLVTAFDAPGLGREAIETGFQAYLTKPVRQSQLFNCITNILYGTTPVIGKSDTDHAVPASGGSQLRNELILIAEDHPMNQQVATLYMSELGFMSHVVNNGQEAIEALSRHQYSLVLMDCQMPVLDGLAAAKAIRKNEALTGHHIPLIAMTANAMKEDREKCMAAGMDDYISKPVDPEELKVIIERWVPASQQAGASLLPVKPQDDATSAVSASTPLNIPLLREKYPSKALHVLAGMFVSSTPGTLGEISDAIAQEDYTNLAALAHYFKGAAMTICASRIEELCSQLEKIAGQGDASAAKAIFEQLQSAFNEAKQYLDTNLPDEMDEDNNPQQHQARQWDVLLVEDDHMLSIVMSAQLAHVAGISVRRAFDGHQAMTMIREQTPALMILDISLPGVNGFEIIDALRQDPALCSMPVIINTSQDLTAAEQRQLTLGRMLFITKTRATEELAEAVLHFLESIAAS